MDRRLKELLDWLQSNQGQGRMYNLPETLPEGWTPNSPGRVPKDDSGIWKGPHKLPEDWTPTRRGTSTSKPDDYFEALLNKAQVGSAMPKYHSGQRKNIRDLSTEMATDPLSYVSDNVRGPQLGGVPESDRKFVDSMHSIQNAYFTGADFGYEEGWAERLGVPEEQISMFMAVPEEAIKYAMNNPTDAVLEQFEEYYGFPLNVNDQDMQEYFERADRGVGSRGKWNQDHLDGQMLGKLYQDGDGYYAIMDPEGESRFGGYNLTIDQQRNGVRIEIPASMINDKGFRVGDWVPDDDYAVVNGVLGYKDERVGSRYKSYWKKRKKR